MKLYELTLDNVFYVDQQRQDVYVLHIRYPQYFNLKQKQSKCLKASIDIDNCVGRPEVRYHEGKFTRFNVTYHFPNTGLSKPNYKVNLLFHSEFIKITKHHVNYIYRDLFSQLPTDFTDSETVSLDQLEENFSKDGYVGQYWQATLQQV
ncbi:hypothetical protein [Ligilactobacillus apodemi]|uniref:Uncharacterized protein n=1 Tax=Ligilactobacillus apodemi DSM 16634 = JCM 16172 TaxID=1423724 RepID=A0A0R1U116_9LACO|nr:hypothetical protein [Ligilactobacillus apodemi]KRL84581.1 hypothetical protein FC32_GL000472 [Ligilactobacillus apodemi DSM 16634 = JCM 16172]MCR1900835.1 hypothetical protein [Ligilactobacillus apodemi]